jgi:dsRNA-specific ribonuclease
VKHVRGSIIANVTHTYLALHHDLHTLLEPYHGHHLFSNQGIIADAYEAYIGVLYFDHMRNYELHRFFDWLTQVYDLHAWPQAQQDFWCKVGKPIPGERPFA